MKGLQQYIEEAEAVSFDIFDTLIVRLYRQPTDLFQHLEQSFQLNGFKAARIAAEWATRAAATAQGRHEVTLDEIYREMHTSYRQMEQHEIQLELQMCKANPEMKAVFDHVKGRNVPIYISSDMYLPRDVIETILSNAGYHGYQELLLSSETMRPKATGEMYEDLIALAGVPASGILHIGDHRYTDYEMARSAGLQAYCYEPIWRTAGQNRNSAFFAVLNQYADQDVSLSILEGLTALNGASRRVENYWEEFGYKYIGILTYGYIKWLKERLDRLGIKKAYFMLRDGYIMKRVFDALYPEFETHEIYGSRRLFLFAGMQKYEDIKGNITGIHTKGITYAEFWSRLGLENRKLEALYTKAFPNQKHIISDDEAIQALDAFMEKHMALLLKEGIKERNNVIAYLKEIGVLAEPAAVVDLGWKGSMLRELENICKIQSCKSEITGFYLGTHSCDTVGMHVESYLLDHGRTTGARNAEVLLDYGFTIQMLELAFSAPHPSILKLEQRNETFIPVYQNASLHETERIEISRQILSGAVAFAKEMREIEQNFPIGVFPEAALAPLEYLSKFVTRAEQARIEQVYYFPGVGDDNSCRPILRQGHPVIGIINPWPGDMSAESELIARLKRTAEENQIACVVLDHFGHLLDEHQNRTPQRVVDDELSFVITTQYETPKTLNAFYYHGVWNPPEIPLNSDEYSKRITNNYLMNDDFLIYDSGGMSNHLRSILMNCSRTLEGASSLTTTSFPLSSILPPKLDDPVMFYCGMNWERVVHGTNRHEGLFKLLDDTKKVKFFGPEQVDAWGGLRPWDGYECYAGSIPFDGFSILKEINHCGICLVLSSDSHRRAGAATNRTYEACAAGAVIISDENEFMLRHFKDAALFIDYNKNNPKDTFQQIMEKYDWIVEHPNEALALARKAQEIFIEKFSLDTQLNKLIENHPARFAQIGKDLYALDDSKKILVTFVLNSLDLPTVKWKLERMFENIHGQLYRNIELGIAADSSICGELEIFCKTRCACAHIIAMELFDKKGSRRMTDGQAIRQLQKQIPHTYYVNASAEEIWFFDHLTSMVRAIENSGALCAYSGSLFHDCNGFRHVNFFETLDRGYLYDMINKVYPLEKPERPLASGQFLFHADAHLLVPDFLFDCLDGKEHIAYAGLIRYKHEGKLAFTRRMSLCINQDKDDSRGVVVSILMQGRFIQDLIRFDIPEQGQTVQAGGDPTLVPVENGVSKRTITDLLLWIPLRSYIRLRYYRFRMRRLKPGSGKYKRIEAKYAAVLKQYNDFWGV